MSASRFIDELSRSPGFVGNPNVKTSYPPGHYFSPVVDPSTVRTYVEQFGKAAPRDIAGIDLQIDIMEALWLSHQDFIAATPFREQPDGSNRYFSGGGPYPIGDAVTLRLMIGAHRPRRIVEIGSGFSSAVMLDAAEHASLGDFHLTCIEPYPKRLKSLLRDGDERRVDILDRGVQGMPLDMFESLKNGEILFIDSTHVLKTGSDVHYELFHILPVLRPGVLVHIHDCRYPFEYPPAFIFDKNYSWNEAYAVRAFLMYNRRFKVVFYNSLFAAQRTELVRRTFPSFLKNPGSSIWLQIQDVDY